MEQLGIGRGNWFVTEKTKNKDHLFPSGLCLVEHDWPCWQERPIGPEANSDLMLFLTSSVLEDRQQNPGSLGG